LLFAYCWRDAGPCLVRFGGETVSELKRGKINGVQIQAKLSKYFPRTTIPSMMWGAWDAISVIVADIQAVR
jgi:hypothetical protein